MIPEKMSGSDFAIAATVNVLLFRGAAVYLKVPGWMGGAAAAVAMAIAVDPTAAPGARQVAGALSAPGALAIKLIRGDEFAQIVKNHSDCDCPGGGKDAPCRC
jgi:hypothetical protein